MMLGNHCTVGIACASLGVSEASFYRWLEKGETRAGLYRDFREMTIRARAIGQANLVKIVNAGAEKDPRLALDLLARLNPAYARKLEVRGAHGGPPIATSAALEVSQPFTVTITIAPPSPPASPPTPDAKP